MSKVRSWYHNLFGSLVAKGFTPWYLLFSFPTERWSVYCIDPHIKYKFRLFAAQNTWQFIPQGTKSVAETAVLRQSGTSRWTPSLTAICSLLRTDGWKPYPWIQTATFSSCTAYIWSSVQYSIVRRDLCGQCSQIPVVWPSHKSWEFRDLIYCGFRKE